MPTQLIAKGVNAEPDATEFSAPIRRGLEAIHFTNVTGQLPASRILQNYAPGKSKFPARLQGSPTPTPSYLSCTGLTNLLETSMSETDEMTLFVVARTAVDGSASATRPMFMGNYRGVNADGGAAFGVGMYLSALNRISATAGVGANAADNTNIVSGVTKPVVANVWSLLAMRVSAAGVLMRDYTGNLENTVALGGKPRRKALGKIRVGSGQSDLTGACDIGLFQGHSVALTDDEMLTTALKLRAYMARVGITV